MPLSVTPPALVLVSYASSTNIGIARAGLESKGDGKETKQILVDESISESETVPKSDRAVSKSVIGLPHPGEIR